MQGVDVEDALPCYDCALQAIMCESSIPRAWQMLRPTGKTNVEKLWALVLGRGSDIFATLPLLLADRLPTRMRRRTTPCCDIVARTRDNKADVVAVRAVEAQECCQSTEDSVQICFGTALKPVLRIYRNSN